MTGSMARECGELEELLLYRMGPPKEAPTCQNLRAVVVKCCCFWAEVPRKKLHGSAILQGFNHWVSISDGHPWPCAMLGWFLKLVNG